MQPTTPIRRAVELGASAARAAPPCEVTNARTRTTYVTHRDA